MLNKRAWSYVLILLLMSAWLVSCKTVPVTGRRQLNFVPDSIMNSLSFQSYSEFLSKHKLSTDTQQTAMVKRVGKRIQHAVERYCAQHNISLKDYKWEFNLVEDKAVNAWCMPGGKVVVYTGLLPVAKTDAGLAVVMGHEIAHAIAKHGSERMSQGLLAQLGQVTLSKALEDKPEATKKLFMLSYGAVSTVGVILPFSRLQESEADHLGLIFMAMAGYNPEEAVKFWQRMMANKKGGSTPELLSTHPSDAKRIKQLQALMPEAMKYYRQSQKNPANSPKTKQKT